MFYNSNTADMSVVNKMNANLLCSSAYDSDYHIPVPEGLSYLPYQKAGIEYGVKNAGVLIADEPGLGKTIQAIGIINKDSNMKKILVVCPSALKINWRRELKRWLVRYRSIGIVNSEASFRNDIVIMNYEVLEQYTIPLHAIKWDMIIVDECHNIRNPDTIKAQQIVGSPNKQIPPIQATRRVFLSGTPILNRVKELWTTVSYLNPKIWNSYESFAATYCKLKPGEIGDKDDGSSNLEDLQHLLRSTVMVRRMKKEVLKQLPPKFREIVELNVESTELRALIEEENAFANNMERDYADVQYAIQTAESLEHWEQYEAATAHLYELKKYALFEISKIRHKTALLKCPMVIEYIDDTLASVDKIVVFAHHQDVINMIKKHYGTTAVAISGQESDKQKQAAVDAFQTDSKIRVCIASILAAGVGLTLTAAHHVIFAELDWVPANVTQAEDRCHRIGQDQPVIIKHVVLNGSIDVKVAKKIISKQDICDRALN